MRYSTYLLGEAADALHQVLVGGRVVRHELAHLRDDVKGELVVDLPQQRVLHVAELQNHHTPALAQHAVRLPDRFLKKTTSVCQRRNTRVYSC